MAGPGRGCWHRAYWRRLRSAPPGAAGDLQAAGAHLGGLRLAWLGVVVAAQGVALAGGTVAQRQLLAAGGASLRWRTVFGLVLASTGLAADKTARQILAACGAHGTGTRGSTASTGKTGAVTDTRPG